MAKYFSPGMITSKRKRIRIAARMNVRILSVIGVDKND
jgi:hypothetical protein